MTLPEFAPDFRKLFESAPDLYLVLTADFQIVAVSDAYCRATFSERDRIMGRSAFDIFPENPSDLNAQSACNLRASLARVLQFRAPDAAGIQKYDIQRSPAAGGGFEERYWAPLNTPVLSTAGEVVWIIHRVEDVTELVRLQSEDEARAELARRQQHMIDQLRTTGMFLDAVIENLPGMLFVKSVPDSRFVLFNRAGEDLLGYSRNEFMGKTDYDFFPKDQAEQFISSDRAALDSGMAQITPEEPIDTRSKGRRLLRTTKVPVRDKDGKPQYLLGFSEDITERKTMEQHLRQSLKMEAVGQLASGVAHDYNNLLGVIIGNLDMATSRAQSDPILLECIEEALKGALRGANLSRRLLAFSRKLPLRPASVDLNSTLQRNVVTLRRMLGEQIIVELRSEAELWPVLVDSEQMDEAILHLALNARDAMAQGGTLIFEISNRQFDEDTADKKGLTAGDYVQLSAGDNGSGMKTEVLERCFEPFFTTKRAEKGSGLGLSMVHGFIQQSGGHVSIHSEVGRGTNVLIYLPRAQERTESGRQANAEPKPVALGWETVLVVEDNEDLRNSTIRQLAGFGYRTLAAENARIALDMLAEHSDIALLFTDIVMPGEMTGTELAIEAQGLYPNLKILLTSGSMAGLLSAGVHGGHDLDLLLKPFRQHDLASRLRRLLDQK